MKYIYSFLSMLVIASATHAQFSFDATNPMVVCNQPNGQGNVRAVKDTFTSTGGYFVFWLDRRTGTAANGQVYGQRLNPDGNILWENQGRPVVATSNVSNLTVVPWQRGLLLSYVLNQDSVMCRYLDSNGHNLWAQPVTIATKGTWPVTYVYAGGCFGIFPTTTGAAVTYYITFSGGSTAIGYNKIDFNGNVLLPNNSVSYPFSGYDYRSVSDGQDGLYVLSKGNGLGSTMTIDRLNANGSKAWATGVEITGGGGPKGFSGNISLNTASNHELYVTWDASNGDVLHTRVTGSGSLAWADPVSLSNLRYNSKRCYARIGSNDSVYITWLKNTNGVTSTMLQKTGPDRSYALPAGGKAVGIANDYYAYPKMAFGGNNAVSFFSTTNASTVGIGAQGLKPDHSLLWTTPRSISNAYLKWNFYEDFVVLDNATDCNTIFWTGFDGNIYGANTCKNAAVLAITTGSLKVETVGTRNKISWESYNEMAGNSYEVERSPDAGTFVSLTLIKGVGTNSSYAFWDETATVGTNFYRIKLNNASGRTEYSNVVKAVTDSKKAVVLLAYPNPAKGLVTISLNRKPGRNNVVSMYDMTGKVVKSLAMRSASFTVDMTHFLPGVYLIQYKDDNQQAVYKIRKE